MFAFLFAIFVMLILQANGVPWSRWRWIVIWFAVLTATTALTDRVELAKSRSSG